MSPLQEIYPSDNEGQSMEDLLDRPSSEGSLTEHRILFGSGTDKLPAMLYFFFLFVCFPF